MDQNTPRDEGAGGRPPAEPVSGDTGAWNQTPGRDPSQAAGGGQEAAAEYAAWSAADTSYGQQAPQPQPAAPPITESGTYAAPEPQSATYSEQPAEAQPQYQQQYQQPQYQQQPQQQQPQYQQQYQQPQYQQQPPYDQQQYQQQQQQPQQYGQYQQSGYDQGAYGQGYGYQQPQYYDPSAYGQQQYPPQGYQPGYYDQSAYGQQPGYYDQSAYGQYQQGYGAQPPQPYGYAQPGQEAWPGQDQYWDQGATGYGRSFMAVLSAWILLTLGVVWFVVGALVLWVNSVTELIGDLQLSPEAIDLAQQADEQIVAVGGIALIIGIIHVIAAVGVFGHRSWGRAFAIVLGLLGVLIGLGIITFAAGFEALDVGVTEAIEGEEGSLAASVFVTVVYLFVLLAMFVGRRHFRRRGIES